MPAVQHPQSLCRFGLARCDITPPVGIYHRMWGAATHDQATGIHRPLTATAMLFQPLDASMDSAADLILLAIDHVLLWSKEMDQLRADIARRTEIPHDRLAITFSHTHAAGLMGLERVGLPGGDLIPPYLDTLAERLAHIVQEARAQMQPVSITYGTGRCALGQHRDFWDEQSRQYVCGYNPGGPADDAVLVARINRRDGQPLAVVVNYACHPTTLAWDNTLISPDFPGAMREVVEGATGVPCVFVQGASGDIGPREGYVGDPAVADRNGRQLGYAVLSAWEALPPPLSRYTYTGPVISGATIGTWAYELLADSDLSPLQRWQLRRWDVALPYRDDLPTIDETKRDIQAWQKKEQAAVARGDAEDARNCRALVERMMRRLTKLEALPPGPTLPYPVILARIGDAIWLALEAELYNWFQRSLRQRFPGVPILIATLTNGWRPSYLPTADVYGKGIYQESIALAALGCLEQLLDEVSAQIGEWLKK